MDVLQEKVIYKFTKIFTKEIAENINNEILLYLKQHSNINDYNLYINKVKDTYNILNHTYDKEKIINLIKKEEFNINNLINNKTWENANDKWENDIKLQEQKDNITYTNTAWNTTTLYTCKNCLKTKGVEHSNNCTFYQLQTRSSDEPMTTFIRCLNCSKVWKD
tara:strand:- start:216 stop:707 length:492 start_codon:yes stop_codon:yes gene_type:complete